jgi:hypothetical protein
MLTKYIPNTITRGVGRSMLVGSKHSPTILFVGGVAGVVGTVVLACRATLKAPSVIDDLKKNLDVANEVVRLESSTINEKDTNKAKAYIYFIAARDLGKLYGPSVVLGSLSIAALTGSHNILTKRNAGLTAAYAVIEKSFDDYRKRVKNELGEDKDREFLHGTEDREIIRDSKQGAKIETIKSPKDPSKYARFFDQSCPRFQGTPEYNLYFLKCAQIYANDMLRSRGHITLNEVYDAIGIPRSEAGFVVGWVWDKGGDDFVDFGIFDSNGQASRDFVNGREGAILLDFNVDGLIYNKI